MCGEGVCGGCNGCCVDFGVGCVIWRCVWIC